MIIERYTGNGPFLYKFALDCDCDGNRAYFEWFHKSDPDTPVGFKSTGICSCEQTCRDWIQAQLDSIAVVQPRAISQSEWQDLYYKSA